MYICILLISWYLQIILLTLFFQIKHILGTDIYWLPDIYQTLSWMLMDPWNMRCKPALIEPKRKQMYEVVPVQTCVCVSQQRWHRVTDAWVTEGQSLRLSGVWGCFSEEMGLQLRAEECIGEFSGAREGEPKKQEKRKGDLYVLHPENFWSSSMWAESENVGWGCREVWLRERQGWNLF